MKLKEAQTVIQSILDDDEMVAAMPPVEAPPEEGADIQQDEGTQALEVLNQILARITELVELEKGEGEEVEGMEDDLDDIGIGDVGVENDDDFAPVV